MGVTQAGLALLSNLLGDVDSPTAATYIAVGDSNTAYASTQTTLQSEITGNGLARAVATITQETTTYTDDTTQYYHQWSVTGSETVREVGVFNASSAGTMPVRKVTDTAQALTDGSTYSYTYQVIFAL